MGDEVYEAFEQAAFPMEEIAKRIGMPCFVKPAADGSSFGVKAKESDMNEAEYLRLLISQKPNDYPEIRKLIKELINEVNHIGVNINQIVHHHNYELYSKEDREQLIAYMKKLNKSVKEVVVIIGDQ